MKFKSNLLSIGLLIIGVQAWGGDIVVPASVNDQVAQGLRETKNVMCIDVKLNKQNREIMRTWVGGSFDLNKAEKRTNERLKRTIFKIDVKEDVIRYSSERLKMEPLSTETERPTAPAAPRLSPIAGVQPLRLKKFSLQLHNPLVLELAAPMSVLYREGVSEYKFLKIKEVEAKRPIDDARAIEAAKAFAEENKLIQSVGSDQISEVYVQKRFISEEGADGNAKEQLLQQDVVFERNYQGMPVINSKLVIGLLPDNHEVVLVKHFNWTPVETRLQNNKTLPKIKRQIQPPNAQAVVQRLREKIARSSGTFQRADVQEARRGWFQMQDQMIPVMLFKVDMKYPSGIGTLQRDVLEVVNLAGNDSMLFPQHQTRQAPKKAP